MSTQHTHPLLGRYARSRVLGPLFRNSGSAPECNAFSVNIMHLKDSGLFFHINAATMFFLNSDLMFILSKQGMTLPTIIPINITRSFNSSRCRRISDGPQCQ